MIETTLCYIEKDGAYLMMHRIKKENDVNRGKWVGVGGKFLQGETPFSCVRREIKEETGLTPANLVYRGIIEFISDKFPTELMHLFTADYIDGQILKDCDEGKLVWIDKKDISSLPIWEGDKIFFRLLEKNTPFFKLKLVYKGDKLIEHQLKY